MMGGPPRGDHNLCLCGNAAAVSRQKSPVAAPPLTTASASTAASSDSASARSKVGKMVRVEVRFLGEGHWQSIRLPISVQAAHTLAQAAKVLRLGDEVRISSSSDRSHVDLQA